MYRKSISTFNIHATPPLFGVRWRSYRKDSNHGHPKMTAISQTEALPVRQKETTAGDTKIDLVVFGKELRDSQFLLDPSYRNLNNGEPVPPSLPSPTVPSLILPQARSAPSLAPSKPTSVPTNPSRKPSRTPSSATPTPPFSTFPAPPSPTSFASPSLPACSSATPPSA